jgi:membrane-associated protease RseP (regulator of RpoE activity)
MALVLPRVRPLSYVILGLWCLSTARRSGVRLGDERSYGAAAKSTCSRKGVCSGSSGTAQRVIAAVDSKQGGAVILEVDAGSAAAHAGFEPGDLVTHVGGAPVRDAVDLQWRIAPLQVGETAEFARPLSLPRRT